MLNIVAEEALFTGIIESVSESWVSFKYLDWEAAMINGTMSMRQEDIIFIDLDTPTIKRYELFKS